MSIVKQSPGDEILVKRMCSAMETCEPYHQRWRRKANHVFALYNNYQDFKSALSDASPRGRDDVIRDGQSTWGSELFIPMAFGIVEATLPLVLDKTPMMLAEPQDQLSEENVLNVQYLVNRQQQQMRYELELQDICKTALIYGLALQKVYWKTAYRNETMLVPSQQPRSDNPTGWAQASMLKAVYDDPVCESVDPFDFFWDPYAKDVESADFVVQRSWRPMSYIAKMARSGQWRNLQDLGVVDPLGDGVKYDESWNERMTALGFGNVGKRGADRPHEVLELHTGDEVITVLDRDVCVQSGTNPHWHGEKCFQAYRPTHIPRRFEGKGVIEPMEDLQKEINELRRARRDNAYLILQKCFAFHDGMLETDNFKFGPGLGIPVNGDPREILFPLNVGDIPYAGYKEEEALKADVQFTSGISDPATDGSVQQTATGAQLVHSATSRRTALMTRRLELEIVTEGTSQMMSLNQQKILANRDVRIEVPPSPDQPERRWSWLPLGPAEIAGQFTWAPEGGVGADNTPQKRSDADQMWLALRDNPNIDQQTLAREYVKKYGYKHPEMLVKPAQPDVPPEVLDILVNQFKVPKEMIATALKEALMQQDGQGSPDGLAQPPEAQASANGQGAPAPSAAG